jgi:AraC family transcriptional regulator of adaptative response/methylated-DNA-[protein]-cysteine methyltransferase
MDDDEAALSAWLRDELPAAELVREAARDGGVAGYAAAIARWVDARGGDASLRELPLDLAGTEFQQRVWRALRAIPYGATRSYAELAREVGAPRAVRAVASACASNRVALVVPCHRIVRADGTAGGYRWGSERKARLLEHERDG